MRYAYENDPRRGPGHWLWPLGIAMTLGSAGCAIDGNGVEEDSARTAITIAAVPSATITDVEPVDGGAIVYERLAPRNALQPENAQLSIDVVVRNDQASVIAVDRLRLSYAGPVVMPSVSIEDDLLKLCPGQASAVALPTDRDIAPGESCKLILDQKIPQPGPNVVTIEVFFEGYPDPLTVIMPIAVHQNTPAEGSYRFPARGEDLPAGHYWAAQSSGAGSHHRDTTSFIYAYDAGIIRWDGAWTALHEGASGAFNEDYLVWEQPIYAMADGVVTGFDYDQPDNPAPGQKLNVEANYVVIDHGDESAVYAHFRYDSLDMAVRSVGATVTKGQFLGLVGNSGESSAPHLHVHVTKNGVGMPLLFHEAFLIDRATLGSPPDFDAPFTAVNDQGLPWEKNIIWPSPFLRKGQDTDGAIHEAAITALTSSRAVTAARSTAGNLELVSWDVTGDGDIVRQQKHVAGAATQVAVARPGFNDVVTAFRNSAGNLELISWDVAAGTGGFGRLDEKTAGPVTRVAVTPFPGGGGVVTAFRDGNGDLGLIAWEVAADGEITRHGEATAEAITEVAITTIESPFEGVVTAARTSTGELMVTTWELTAAMDFIRRDDAFGDQVTDIALAPVLGLFGSARIVTAVRTSGGNLKLNAWQISGGGVITAQGSASGGAISEVAIGASNQYHAVTAVRDSSGNLKLIAWELSNAGNFEREGELRGGAATNLALTRAFTVGGKQFVLPMVEDSAGELRVLAVQTNLTL